MPVWQWGITDRELIAKRDALDFELEHLATLSPFPGANDFVNKTFVLVHR